MLLEKIIRRKEIPPYYLELIMGIFYLNLIMIAILSIIEPLSINNMPFYVVASIIVTGAALLELLPVTVISFALLRDRKGKRIVTQDVVITRYDGYPINIPVPGMPGWKTLLCFNYMEPFLQIIDFTAYPINSGRIPLMLIRFFIPSVYVIYFFNKDYKKIKREWKKTKMDAEMYDNKNIEFYETPKKGDGYFGFTLYMTYTKMKELNKLFELVNPPEFRVITYEKSEVFISIEPIPDREYPPEALECMKKINAMYP